MIWESIDYSYLTGLPQHWNSLCNHTTSALSSSSSSSFPLTHLKSKRFRPSFMHLYDWQFDNSGHRGFRDKKCQLLMHSMKLPSSVEFFLLVVLSYLEEQFGYKMTSTFKYTRWLPIRTIILETKDASLHQDTRLLILHKHLNENTPHIQKYIYLERHRKPYVMASRSSILF